MTDLLNTEIVSAVLKYKINVFFCIIELQALLVVFSVVVICIYTFKSSFQWDIH